VPLQIHPLAGLAAGKAGRQIGENKLFGGLAAL
jgi:hypothetical protein